MFQIKSFVFSPIQENTYILYTENKECIIIDPGCYFDEEKEQIKSFIEHHHLIPLILLNTHCHLDHVFGNKFIFDTYQLKPHIHILEKDVLAYAPVSGVMYDMPFDHYDGDVVFLEEGQEINLGDNQLKVLFTPGHSPGSISFFCEKEHFIVSGDVLFKNSIGRTDLPGGHASTLLESIRKKLFTLPEETIVYSGHGQPTQIGSEKKTNPFFN